LSSSTCREEGGAEHPADGDRLVVAIALEIERREAQQSPEKHDPGQCDQMRRGDDATERQHWLPAMVVQ
jgi:hypothetical protein